MAANRKIRLIFAFLSAGLCLPVLLAQQPAKKPAATSHKAQRPAHTMPDLVTLASEAIQSKDYAKAESELKQWLKDNPQDHAAWFDLGFVYRATDRNQEAVDAYRKSVLLKPDIFESNLQLGTTLAIEHNNAEAAKYLRKAVALTPQKGGVHTLADAWLLLAQVTEKDAPKEALQSYRKAESLSPKDPDIPLAAGDLLQESGDLKGAVVEYQKSLDLNPESQEARLRLADVYVQQGEWQQAEGLLQEYLKQNPADTKAEVQLGNILLRTGDQDEAIQVFQNILAKYPENELALRALAPALAERGRYKESASVYAELLKKAPETADLRNRYATTLMKSQRYAEAVEQFIAAIRLAPKNVEAYNGLAISASENKNYELAIRALQERAKYAEATPGTYFLLATSYDNLHRYKEAAENYHNFLSVAAGKFPDQEWQARHRLITIEPKK